MTAKVGYVQPTTTVPPNSYALPPNVVGHCPRCGMPIVYDSGFYWSILPPSPRRTCSCFAGDTITTDRTS